MSCPHCGYCPHCKRGGYRTYPYPHYYPPYYHQYPYYGYPTTVATTQWGNQSVGGGASYSLGAKTYTT